MSDDLSLTAAPGDSAPPDDPRCTALDATRGVSRWFFRQRQVVLAEVPLPNGRRADLVAIDAKGLISIVEIKVARADLLGDAKWPDYLDWCDHFYWALAAGMDDAPLDDPARLPDRCGRLFADRYDAMLIRPAEAVPLAPARRRSEILRLGRLAALRTMLVSDPDLLGHASSRDIGL